MLVEIVTVVTNTFILFTRTGYETKERNVAKRPTSVAGQVLILQLIVMAVIVLAGGFLTIVNERSNSDEATRREVIAVAASKANEPTTTTAIA
jgi:hypothetical protein